ncbi:KamA family radical SAM protein [Patescibacteria group bacterium]|nr:KamA family radical SAM protein [Patescibacteria group bacterium]MBU1673912.1 KamA family radical SAM protein [Patescibacteria group bacterium]MBU1963906.1 KamA family radical SAM protein [Patescibacteria group bacterium]
MLSKRLSPHLETIIKTCPAVHREFVPSKKEGWDEKMTTADPLMEEEHTATRGLVHKYGNRALVLLTMNCAAYCRFCTRRRKVSDLKKGVITDKDLDNIVAYLKKHPEIKELIISGGDPLTVPILLKKALTRFSRLPQIKVLRVGTRLPVSDPRQADKKVLAALDAVKRQPLYLMVHFEHPAEINPATVRAIRRLQPHVTMILSQSVFLKGVNDNVKTLYDLFSGLIEIGIKPYYIFRCDYVSGAEHFIVDFKKETEIMTKLRSRLSGLACPLYVIDVPGGAGKVPAPLNFWKWDKRACLDFNGTRITLKKL